MTEFHFIFLFSSLGALYIGNLIGTFLGNLIVNSIDKHFQNKDFISNDWFENTINYRHVSFAWHQY